jgi:hypothetical protein
MLLLLIPFLDDCPTTMAERTLEDKVFLDSVSTRDLRALRDHVSVFWPTGTISTRPMADLPTVIYHRSTGNVSGQRLGCGC